MIAPIISSQEASPWRSLRKKHRSAADPERTVLNPIWENEKVLCVGTGDSLRKSDIDYCANKAKIIAVNNAYKLAPYADLLYASDSKWWIWHEGATDFRGWRLTREREAALEYEIDWIESFNKSGLSQEPDKIHNGYNSGYQAVNVAYLLGCRDVYLLGYDMQKTNNKTHYFGDHPDGRTPPFKKFIEAFTELSKMLPEYGLTITNVTRETALECFPRKGLQECF